MLKLRHRLQTKSLHQVLWEQSLKCPEIRSQCVPGWEPPPAGLPWHWGCTLGARWNAHCPGWEQWGGDCFPKWTCLVKRSNKNAPLLCIIIWACPCFGAFILLLLMFFFNSAQRKRVSDIPSARWAAFLPPPGEWAQDAFSKVWLCFFDALSSKGQRLGNLSPPCLAHYAYKKTCVCLCVSVPMCRFENMMCSRAHGLLEG